MKKKLVLLGMAAVTTLALGACGSSSKESKESSDVVTLKYANWNLGTESDKNLERLMIDEFNKAHKDIKVEIDNSINGDDYTGKINTAASAGKLPDVFMINDIPSNYKNDWLLDISELASKDEDYEAIDSTIKETTKVGEKVVALPFAKHLLGYYINNDILDSLNLEKPAMDSKVEDFVAAIKTATDLDKGFVGTDNAQTIVDWYPGQVNTKMGWFTFADGKFQLDSKEMIEGVNVAKDLVTNKYSYNDLPQAEKDKLSGDDSGKAFKAGQVAYYYNGTYMNADLQKNADFNFEFIGLPGGRQAVSSDFLGISKSTKNKEAAYEFAKYLSFGKEGFKKRLDLAEDKGLELATLPLTTNKEMEEKYWEIVTVPGVKETNEKLENAMFEPIKVVPGYIQARYEASTGLKIGDEENANVGALINAAASGKINYQDYAAQLQELAQKQYDDANKAMNN